MRVEDIVIHQLEDARKTAIEKTPAAENQFNGPSNKIGLLRAEAYLCQSIKYRFRGSFKQTGGYQSVKTCELDPDSRRPDPPPTQHVIATLEQSDLHSKRDPTADTPPESKNGFPAIAVDRSVRFQGFHLLACCLPGSDR
jgi:hypothetical protein